MSRRIEVELTSARDDGSWTWRAAGAKQPKGVLNGSLLPSGSSVGDVLRAEVDTGLDGTEVMSVLAPKSARPEPERLEILGTGAEQPLVTTTLAGRRGGDRGDRGDRDRGPRRPRRDGGGRDRDGRPGGSTRTRDGGGRDQARDGEGPRGGQRKPAGEGRSRERPRRTAPPEDTRPKPKRLRAGRANRKQALEALPAEQQAVAEQVLKGGIPAVRSAVAKQNEQAKAEGRPEVKAEPLVALAESLLPKLRAAEWRDRAEAAIAEVDELDLRDLRSVVVAADGAARDDETRAMATELREGLARRVEHEQSTWLAELATTLADGRIVRALRLSSRPPKAGSPLPPDLAQRLTDSASEALTADASTDRWTAVLDALQFAPVHQKVEPASYPEKPSDELVTAVRKASSRLPQIAAKFGIEPAAPGARTSRGRKAKAKKASAKPPVPPPPPPAAPAFDSAAPTTEAPPDAAPTTDVPAPAAGASADAGIPTGAADEQPTSPAPAGTPDPAPSGSELRTASSPGPALPGTSEPATSDTNVVPPPESPTPIASDPTSPPGPDLVPDPEPSPVPPPAPIPDPAPSPQPSPSPEPAPAPVVDASDPAD